MGDRKLYTIAPLNWRHAGPDRCEADTIGGKVTVTRDRDGFLWQLGAGSGWDRTIEGCKAKAELAYQAEISKALIEVPEILGASAPKPPETSSPRPKEFRYSVLMAVFYCCEVAEYADAESIKNKQDYKGCDGVADLNEFYIQIVLMDLVKAGHVVESPKKDKRYKITEAGCRYLDSIGL